MFGLPVGLGLTRSSFSPINISGLALWLDASDASTLFTDDAGTTPATSDGDVIGKWADKSGAGRHHKQSTGARKPVLKKAAQNSKDVIEFSASAFNYLVPDIDFTSLTAATAFWVVKAATDYPSVTSSNSGFCHYGQVSSGYPTTHYPWSGDGIIYDSFGTTQRKTTVNPSTALDQWNIYSVCTASSGWTNWLNSTQLYATATNSVAFCTTATAKMGSNDDNVYKFDGRLAEFIVYNSELSAGNRKLVRDYLRAKWNTPFTPDNVLGLQLWLDAADATTLFQNSDGTTAATADTDPVGYWADKSGNARHATQSNSGKRPQLKTNIINSKNAIFPDATDDYLQLASSITLSGAWTLYVVGVHAGGFSSWFPLASTADYTSLTCTAVTCPSPASNFSITA